MALLPVDAVRGSLGDGKPVAVVDEILTGDDDPLFRQRFGIEQLAVVAVDDPALHRDRLRPVFGVGGEDEEAA